MADSLLVSQCLRLIRGGDKKCMKHLEYWLGDLLGNFVLGIGQGVRSVDTPDYFGCIGGLLTDLLATDTLTAGTLKTITNKAVYAVYAEFPPPKVARESNRDYGIVWKRLHSPVVEGQRCVVFAFT